MKLILGSGSPRRADMLREAGYGFEIRRLEVDEQAPPHLDLIETAHFLAEKKAQAFKGLLADDEVVLTCDTEVWHRGKRLGKPIDAQSALKMLMEMRDDTHQVISGFALMDLKRFQVHHVLTEVRFGPFPETVAKHYIDYYQPFDKAGSYGIQEWFGLVGVVSISGSYTNVIGLPMFEVMRALADFGIEPGQDKERILDQI
jgi:septum formation protein